MMKPIQIEIDNKKELKLNQLREIVFSDVSLTLSADAIKAVNASAQAIQKAIESDEVIYGVNTGFGDLSEIKIPNDQLKKLQKNLILSHAAGTGPLLDNNIVSLILALKINSLSRGISGIRLETLERLVLLFNKKSYPSIPSKGSVGASGDLAPLAHLSLTLLGEGELYFEGKRTHASKVLKKMKVDPVTFEAKEGLALINGTQVSTAIALKAFFYLERIFNSAMIAGSLSLIAAGQPSLFLSDQIHQARNQLGQQKIAKQYRKLLENCEYAVDKARVQSPYSLRCQPQVMGAALDQLNFASQILEREANGVSDNPLIFVDEKKIISGGNFHGEPIAFAADNLALIFAEIGSISERRTALLIDDHFSGLPSFLVPDAGVNSGFMSAQVTAAALVSENKSLAHPASVDTIPTSANQEDHVSMATFGARRLLDMAENTATVIAIELLAACQGIDLKKPKRLSGMLKKSVECVRRHVAFYEKDRYFAPDIEKIKRLIMGGAFER